MAKAKDNMVSSNKTMKPGKIGKGGKGSATGINHAKSPSNKKATGLGNSMKQGAGKGDK